MNLIKLLTSPASERYDFLMKVVDNVNKMQAATVKKAEKMEKAKSKKHNT